MQPEIKQTPLNISVGKLPSYAVPKKRWKLTRADNLDPARRSRNAAIDSGYMYLLGQVKDLYRNSGTQAFERNLRDDRSFTAAGMHVWCTSDLYLELQCDYDLICRVSYDFEKCPYQIPVMQILNGIYRLNEACVHKPLQGGVAAYYERMIVFQGRTYLSTL